MKVYKKYLYTLLTTLGFLIVSCDVSPRMATVPPFSLKDQGKVKATYNRQFTLDKVRSLVEKTAPLDILWVIDNSGSMGFWQSEISANINKFMQEFYSTIRVDWKMGVISTDPAKAPLGFDNSISSTSKDPITSFKQAVTSLGTNGNPLERAFVPIKKALSEAPNFLRGNSLFVIIIITDAPEQSGNMKSQEMISYLSALKGKSFDTLSTYGVFGAKDLGCQVTDGVWDYEGSQYDQFIKGTNGKYFPLCSPNFGENLASIAKDAVTKGYVYRILLESQNIPVLSTLSITYQDQPVEQAKWSYDTATNSIQFKDLTFWTDPSALISVSFDIKN